jgi:hypothetical protein
MKLSAMIFAAAILPASALAHSQSVHSVRSVNIPFAFTAQGHKLAAGRYLMWYEEDQRTWKLRTFAHMDVELEVVRQNHPSMGQRDTLSFDDINGNYLLTEIQEAGMPISRIAPGTDHRKEFASARAGSEESVRIETQTTQGKNTREEENKSISITR